MPIFETMESWQNTLPQWLESFGIGKDDVLSLIVSLKKTECPIRRLIETQKLEETAWLTWAKNHFQLPVLKENFILSENQKSLHDRYRGLFPDSVAPIVEWDGVLFLACLAPVPGFQSPQKHQWVLGSLAQIRLLRHEPPTMAEIGAPADPHSLPEGLLTEASSETFPVLETEAQEPTVLLQTEEPPVLEAPLGIDPDLEKTAALSLDFSALGSSSEVEAVTAPSLPTPNPAPIPPPIPDLQAASPSVQGLDHAGVLQEATMPSVRAEPPPVELKLEGPPPIPSFQEPAVVPPPLPFPPQTLTVVATNETPPTEVVSSNAEVSRTNLGISSQEIDQILAEMKKTCGQAMLLLFHNDSLKVWRASDDWYQDKSRSDLIDLSNPSIFRIVKLTKLPYHGYVVSNPINDSFFQTWNKGKTPQHVTIVPVLYEQNLVGMLLGTASFEQAPKISLESLQALGLEAGLSLVSQAAA